MLPLRRMILWLVWCNRHAQNAETLAHAVLFDMGYIFVTTHQYMAGDGHYLVSFYRAMKNQPYFWVTSATES